MSPMALNVPVAMLMSMLVAFTITPWLTYHVLKKEFPHTDAMSDAHETNDTEPAVSGHAAYDPQAVKQTRLYKFFRPLMLPLLKNRFRAIGFLAIIGILTVAAMGLGAMRLVPLKMLPFDNKNEFLILLFPYNPSLILLISFSTCPKEQLSNAPQLSCNPEKTESLTSQK